MGGEQILIFGANWENAVDKGNTGLGLPWKMLWMTCLHRQVNRGKPFAEQVYMHRSAPIKNTEQKVLPHPAGKSSYSQ